MLSESLEKRVWQTSPIYPELEKSLTNELGISQIFARVLISRGFKDAQSIEKHLHPKLENFHNPALLPDCEIAIRELMLAKEQNEKIFIHGDYDVDGVTSATIWSRSLSRLGFNVETHVPHRMKEGYGIHDSAVRKAKDSGAKLFLTCDCGSSAVENVALAKELGMRVVITDHHQLPVGLPEAHAIVNPSRKDSKYPFPHLSGAGVAFKVAQAVSEECGVDALKFQRGFLDLACLGTIADVVPLLDENRLLVSFGLKLLPKTQKIGLQALLEVASIENNKPITAFDVGWKIGPRINAAGRIDDSSIALQLLLTNDESEARKLANILNDLNAQRKTEQERVFEHAEELIFENQLDSHPLLLVYSAGWHEGVIGIVAGKLAEKYYKPTLVATLLEETGKAKGSARSIPGINLYELLFANEHLFLSYGGHERAAGFSLEIDKLEEAHETLLEWTKTEIHSDIFIPKLYADAVCSARELNEKSLMEMLQLEPFGEGNPAPMLIIEGGTLSNVRTMGENEKHVRITLSESPSTKVVGFNLASAFTRMEPGQEVELLVSLKRNDWNGKTSVDCVIEDFRV